MITKQIILDSIEAVKEFSSVVNTYQFEIDLKSGKYVVDAKSIMGIFSLDISRPVEIIIHSENCADLLDELKKFLVD